MEFQFGNENSGIRQFDMTYANPQFFEIPSITPGRLMADDFVYFVTGNLDVSKYTVVVQSLDTAGTEFRSLGKLQKAVKLPLVFFGPYAKIGVISDSYDLPRFSSILARGATYILPNTKGLRPGVEYRMDRLGGKF